jgi:Icc-related predicted phosphoesterase
MELKIGIISDLHCHSKKNNDGKRDSYLLTDEELPLFQDPYKSFIHLIESGEDIKVDILVMPGDFTNKACPEGLKKGFNIVCHINELMKSKSLISNVGNHDVDSRKKYNLDPLVDLKNTIKSSPIDDPTFWEKGYCIIESEFYRLLIINTAHNHFNKENAEHGDISEEALKYLEDELKLISDDKVGIAITHHCPIEHSHYNSGINDFMHNGDELSKIIDRFNFKLLIHGHKHDPRIRNGQGGINSPFIFSSGSFSAVQDKLLLGGTNTFHIITMILEGKNKGKGSIETWFFCTAKGWQRNIKNQYFEALVGFGAYLDLDQIADAIVKKIKNLPTQICEWNDLVRDFDSICYLIPSDLDKLKNKLSHKGVKSSPVTIGEPIFFIYKKK